MNNIISIRGAITAQNTQDGIRDAAVRLIDKIYFKNGLTDESVVSIIVTVTDGLTAFSPARAIREAGHSVPLVSAVEPNVDDSIKNCIRVMVTATSQYKPYHVYLGGARSLRPDLTAAYAIALDGPSGAGKSTVAKLVAKALKITYLDTGALYRALGYVCVKNGVDVKDVDAVEKCINDVDVNIAYVGGVQSVIVDGEDVSSKIRTPEMSMAASAVSAIPCVRQKLLGLQRAIAEKSSVILDGRDIGTVVLPQAEFKFFLTASAEERARRRFDELILKGQAVTYEDVLSDVITRDRNDSTRAIAPLRRAFDAIEINSDNMSAQDVANYICATVNGDLL